MKTRYIWQHGDAPCYVFQAPRLPDLAGTPQYHRNILDARSRDEPKTSRHFSSSQHRARAERSGSFSILSLVVSIGRCLDPFILFQLKIFKCRGAIYEKFFTEF